VEAVVVLAEAEGLVDDFAVSAMCERLAAGDRSTSHFIASLGHQLATTKGILAPAFFGEAAPPSDSVPAEAAPAEVTRAVVLVDQDPEGPALARLDEVSGRFEVEVALEAEAEAALGDALLARAGQAAVAVVEHHAEHRG
jgi:hypothetical protein